ncbi:MAG: 4Fe-4S dicluster domain-containing protein [Bacteroidota bacterium]|nr:4Fe-4S dicluster domain-containing protein [Bacteroidota bacterium]
MAYQNNTMIIRRDLMERIVRLMHENRLVEDVDRIPIQMAPRENGAHRRCCIYKERAVIKYKIMPVLGYRIDQEEDELTLLSTYASNALKRNKLHDSVLTVVDEACTACVKAKYTVTNLCRGCVARPCMVNCPKQAISAQVNGQAAIDPSKCVNCGLCKEACPYHSIVYVPVPCEEVCPVGAISKDEKGIEHINPDKCIYCGKCINACPFGSIYEISQLVDLFQALKRGEKIIALPAPAFLGQYGEPAGKVVNAIRKIGFHDVIEVAQGAMMTTSHEAQELKERLQEGHLFMTTSCCPSYIQAVRKHVPDMMKYVSSTPSPMVYAAQVAKERYPDAKTVFIGPCVAKRKEAQDNPIVDYVLTFEELDAIFEGLDIKVADCENEKLTYATTESRGFAVSGGVTEAVKAEGLAIDVKAIQISGLNKKSIGLLRAYSKGKCPFNFVEVMACEGGCVAGPSANLDPQNVKKLFTKSIEEIKEVCNAE